MADPSELEPFSIAVPDETLADLRRRLAETKWPTDIDPEDSYYGTKLSYMQDLVHYWANDFDWRAAEAEINSFRHHRPSVDGVPIHFLHEPAVGGQGIPLLLLHGWPWTFWDYKDVIKQLADPGSYGGDPADAFDVYVPSLPGYGFSSPTNRFDLNFHTIADLLHQLMTKTLGVEKYAVAGADYGAWVTGQIGHKYTADLYGIWVAHAIPLNNLLRERPWELSGGMQLPDDMPTEMREHMLAFWKRYSGHVATHILDPQAISLAGADSPVGMLAWILQRWETWSESNGDVESVFPRDHLLTNATIWWVTGTFTSAIRTYSNILRYPWEASHDRVPRIEAPMGTTLLGYDNATGIGTPAEREAQFPHLPHIQEWFNPVYVKAHEKGGHFTPVENPQAVISDVRATFRQLRPSS